MQMSYVPLPEGRKIKGQLSFVAFYFFEGVQTEWRDGRGRWSEDPILFRLCSRKMHRIHFKFVGISSAAVRTATDAAPHHSFLMQF